MLSSKLPAGGQTSARMEVEEGGIEEVAGEEGLEPSIP